MEEKQNEGVKNACDIEKQLDGLVALGLDDDVFRPCDLVTYNMPWKGCRLYDMRNGKFLLSRKAAELFGKDAIEAVSEPVKLNWNGVEIEGHAVSSAQIAAAGVTSWSSLIADWFRQRILGCEACTGCAAAAQSEPVSGDILIGTLAKLLCQRGERTGQNRLFAWMREMGYLCRRSGEMRNMPTQTSVARGLFRISLGVATASDGSTVATRTVRVTPKGVDYFLGMPFGAFKLTLYHQTK